MNDFLFQVADTAFHLHVGDMVDARPMLPSYAPFFVEKATCDLIFNMTVGNGLVSFIPSGEELGQFDCGGNNHGIYRQPDGGYVITIFSGKDRPACALEASADFSRCRATLFGDENERTFGLNNALMIAFAFAGAHHGIVLMHASVTMYGGRGYLFLGKSGTGKSTHSSLWRKFIPGSDLLNDDNPAVRVKADGSVMVYGTPWSGKTPCYRNLSLPVGAYVRLEQHPENVIVRDSKLQAFASLLSSCSTMVWDRSSYDAIIASVSAIAGAVPVYYLKCRPDEEAARLSCTTIVSRQ